MTNHDRAHPARNRCDRHHEDRDDDLLLVRVERRGEEPPEVPHDNRRCENGSENQRQVHDDLERRRRVEHRQLAVHEIRQDGRARKSHDEIVVREQEVERDSTADERARRGIHIEAPREVPRGDRGTAFRLTYRVPSAFVVSGRRRVIGQPFRGESGLVGPRKLPHHLLHRRHEPRRAFFCRSSERPSL